MRKLILVLTITAVIAGMVVVPASAKRADDGCTKVQVKGTTMGDWGGPLIAEDAPAWWHISGGGKALEADVEVTLEGVDEFGRLLTSHTFGLWDGGEFPTAIVTDDVIVRFTPNPDFTAPGSYRFSSEMTLNTDESDERYTDGEFSIKNGSISVVEVDGELIATAQWHMKGFVCEG